MDGLDGVSAFYLQYTPNSGDSRDIRGFAMSFEGGPSAKFNVQPGLGEWFHLAGVYDAEARTLSLYVNGELADTVDTLGASRTTGTLALGRGQWSGNNVDFLNGAIDDVFLLDYAATAADIATMMNGEVPTPPLVEVTAVAPVQVGNVVTVPSVAGVSYVDADDAVVSGDVALAEGETLVVTAVALEGFALADGVTSWTFEYEAPAVPADKAALAAAIAEAEALDAADYTAASFAVLRGALDRAVATLADDEATQAEVDAAVAALATARENLVEAGPVDPGEPVDTSALEAAVAAAKELDAEAFTAESFAGLEAAIAAAEAVLANEDATQAEVDAALAALLSAVDGLVLVTEPTDPTDPTDPSDPSEPGTTPPGDGGMPDTGMGAAAPMILLAFGLLAAGLLAVRRATLTRS